MMSQDLEYMGGDLMMLLEGLGKNQNIVKVDKYLPFGNKIMENIVHQVMESGRGIG